MHTSLLDKIFSHSATLLDEDLTEFEIYVYPNSFKHHFNTIDPAGLPLVCGLIEARCTTELYMLVTLGLVTPHINLDVAIPDVVCWLLTRIRTDVILATVIPDDEIFDNLIYYFGVLKYLIHHQFYLSSDKPYILGLCISLVGSDIIQPTPLLELVIQPALNPSVLITQCCLEGDLQIAAMTIELAPAAHIRFILLGCFGTDLLSCNPPVWMAHPTNDIQCFYPLLPHDECFDYIAQETVTIATLCPKTALVFIYGDNVVTISRCNLVNDLIHAHKTETYRLLYFELSLVEIYFVLCSARCLYIIRPSPVDKRFSELTC